MRPSCPPPTHPTRRVRGAVGSALEVVLMVAFAIVWFGSSTLR